ncbi:phosphate ABC transporter permease subunit PstC [Cellulomonas sp. JH27-2]|uniref:phosphate ABC transporter permease subunit PstC n=1 Tax=Cellulomonas sp. JH27-2 TaxID=2774139 RepID=UPI00177F2507|nr:phosphate ABC transporter permease subunit PstC [Cellulomonas sp. JH27-2]
MTSTQTPAAPRSERPGPGPESAPPRAKKKRAYKAPADRGANRLFRWAATGAGAFILVVLAAVAVFLIVKAWPAISMPTDELAAQVSALHGSSLLAYIGPLVFGTVLAAALALLFATPVAMGIALFTSHYAPRRIASALGYVVDLLAAIPSVVYGLWGATVLVNVVKPLWLWLNTHLSWIPFFGGEASPTGRVVLSVAIVLAVMILPIITAVSREVFLQAPRLHEEAALALGATRWEMIRMAVLPFARSGVISAAMLGLGRALGETMAVVMILSPGATYSFLLLVAGKHNTIAANIASQFPEANPIGVSTLIATGLALFVITLAVNMAARAIVARRKDFSGAN